MKNNFAVLLLMLATFSLPAQQDTGDQSQQTVPTIAQLVTSNQLQITIKRVNEEPTIARQAVIFQVEVATNRWFSRGTRIDKFAMENAIILPYDGLAFNSSRMIEGNTWATQSREITIYPLDEGDYQLPKIQVFISVNTEKYGTVEGTWQLEALNFSVSQPKQLALIDHYVVTDSFSVENSRDFDKRNDYQVGDSITQNVEIVAQRVPAMMLPKLHDIEVEGISVFDEEPRLEDTRARGEFYSTRRQTRTYIFEQAGEYTLPAQKFYYWDPTQNQLKTRNIKGLTIQIKSDPNQQQKNRKNEQLTPIPTIPWRRVIAAVIVTVLLFTLFRMRETLRHFYRKVTRYQRRQYRNAYIKACNDGQYRLSCEYLFRFLRTGNVRYSTLQRYFPLEPQRTYLHELIALAYDINEPIPEKKLVTRGSFARRKMLSLLKPEHLLEDKERESQDWLYLNPRHLSEGRR